ncbi:MAG: isoprenylcysteine carboxylmethyltransferase family protein [Ignavibacteriales bacterium]|nr:isoprenylcysteine carboxylmethyltransferase family protein [Ignavibacteriales bacterium]
MSKLLKTLAVLIFLYVIPLLGNIPLLYNLRIVLLMFTGILMFISQPELKISEAKEKKNTDRNSVFVILLAGGLSQILAIIEWAYFKPAPAIIANNFLVVAGVVMVVGGMAFRIWAIETLKMFFTSTVQIVKGHKVIQHGPYKVVRHPSYLGSMVAIIGSALVLEAPISAVFALCSMIYAYTVRVRVEEITLVAELGDAYREFQKIRKYKVIPFVW